MSARLVPITVRATSCELARPGNFVIESGATEDTPCGPGEYQDEPGAITCKPAGPETYSDSSGLAEPTPCPSERTSR